MQKVTPLRWSGEWVFPELKVLVISFRIEILSSLSAAFSSEFGRNIWPDITVARCIMMVYRDMVARSERWRLFDSCVADFDFFGCGILFGYYY